MRTTTNEKARREVLRALRAGPRTGSQLVAKGARVDKSNVWTLTAGGTAAADEHDRKAAA